MTIVVTNCSSPAPRLRPRDRVLLLDRDGTLIRDYPDARWAMVTQVGPLPGVREAMAAWSDAGYGISIVSNQYLVGERWITVDQFWTQHHDFVASMGSVMERVDVVYYCLHPRNVGCPCTKPRAGALRRALSSYGEPAAMFIGDSEADRQAATAAGTRFRSCTADRRYVGLGAPSPATHDGNPRSST